MAAENRQGAACHIVALNDLPELSTVAEVAAYVRCSTDTIYNVVASGELSPVVRLGRVLRIPRMTVERWAHGDRSAT
jgi:excisionase family DNA binding protein